MSSKRILISGAGVSGLTLAYFLNKNGHNPVVIEKSNTLRKGGYMIDFFSSGISVAEKMGILDQLREIDRGSNTIQQYDEHGEKQFSLNLSGFRKHIDGNFLNFLRSDLVQVIYNNIQNDIPIRFGKSITHIEQFDSEVSVSYNDDTKESFDLLIGADGVNSNVRDLVYPPESIKKVFLQYYLCVVEHDIAMDVKTKEIAALLCPGRQIMTYTLDGSSYTSLFVFESNKLGVLDRHRMAELLGKNFKTFSSPVDRIIEQATKEPNLFFDEVTQIRIDDNWHKNRVALIGDAAFCMTFLSGQGASMAMTSAYVLSEQLNHSDHLHAFEGYENELRPMIEDMQRKAANNAENYIPSTRLKMFIRNLFAPVLFTRIFAPLLAKQLGARNYFERESGSGMSQNTYGKAS